MQFQNRTCILEEALSDEVIKALEKELDNITMPVTFRIYEQKNGKWSVSYESCWKPSINLSCVDKIEGMLKRTQRFMNRTYGKNLFLHVEGYMESRGLNYYLELA